MISQQLRPVIRSLYPIGVLIILSSLIDPLLRVWPLELGNIRWRFGAVGFFSNSVLGVLFGLVWLLVIGLLLEHRKVMRAMALLSLVTGLVLGAVVLIFMLDALQVRSTLRPELRLSFDVSVAKAIATLGLSIPVSLWIGISGWLATRKVRQARPEADVRATGFLVHPHRKEEFISEVGPEFQGN